jgi:aspartyl-tRNA(Asn)/glutamyl-tRNA(Gln) amidotransferase subunit C
LQINVGEGTSYNTLLEQTDESAGRTWTTGRMRLTAISPMTLSVRDVTRIAQLARLELSEGQAEEVLMRLQGVFALIEELQSVDTRGVEPMSHAQDVSLRLREDRVTEGDARERFQATAPLVEAGLYLVPKVIE